MINSTDQASEIEASAGAIVRKEAHQGKENVVRRMFADIDADIYVMVDGDDTYDASAAPILIEHLRTNLFYMVISRRVTFIKTACRLGHRLEKMLTGLGSAIFGKGFNDMLSGKVLTLQVLMWLILKTYLDAGFGGLF